MTGLKVKANYFNAISYFFFFFNLLNGREEGIDSKTLALRFILPSCAFRVSFGTVLVGVVWRQPTQAETVSKAGFVWGESGPPHTGKE